MEQRVIACLHADVSGYCHHINTDVESTVRTLNAYHAMMSVLVVEHHGRVVDTAGDSFLAAFPSVARAVACAVHIQRDLERHNAALPENRRLEFRVGIDLGHVVMDGQRIYGDCVNIAARVQQSALPGGVCLAGTAYDQLEYAPPLRFDYLGERLVKNIDQPQRIYRVG